MEDRLLALKKTKNVNTAAPEMVEEYTEEQIKEIHEKYSRIIKTMYAHGVMADTKLLNDAFQFAMEKHKGKHKGWQSEKPAASGYGVNDSGKEECYAYDYKRRHVQFHGRLP